MGSFLEKYSHNLPIINIDLKKGVFDFSGISNVENVNVFEPTFDMIKRYLENPAPNTQLNFRFEYFNTATSRLLMEVFEMFERLYNKGNEVIVNWYYQKEDIDTKDSGVLYEELCSLPFNHVCLK